jgi:hypothetical protein
MTKITLGTGISVTAILFTTESCDPMMQSVVLIHTREKEREREREIKVVI